MENFQNWLFRSYFEYFRDQDTRKKFGVIWINHSLVSSHLNFLEFGIKVGHLSVCHPQSKPTVALYAEENVKGFVHRN